MKEQLILAYIAGIIDGEGTITLTRNNARSYRSPVLSVTNTSEEILTLLKETFGGSIRNQKVYQQHHIQAYVWSVRYNTALNAIEAIRPYLLHPAKIYRADLILNEYKQVTKRNGQYSVDDLRLKQEFEDRFFHPSVPVASLP